MPASVTTPFSQIQYQGWASFYGGNVQTPAPPPPSFFGAASLGQPPSNGQYTGGWAYPDAWANFYEGKQGFVSPQNQNSPAGALAVTNYGANVNNPNDPNLLGWEQAYGNPSTILRRDQNWAQSLGAAPTGSQSNQLTGGWQNPEAWAAYYGGSNGFTAPANAGSPASALAAASQIAKTSNPLSNPALLGWVQDYGQPGNVLINTPNWAASLGDPKVNAMGQGIDQTNTQGWDSPLAWAAFYGGFQGFNKGPQDNTLQAAQNWAGVTNLNDPSLLGWELDYGNPQTVISTIQASKPYQDYQAAVKKFDAQKAAAQAAFNAQQAAIQANRDTQHGNVESLQVQNAGIQNQINQYGATPDLVAQLNNNNAIIARIQSDPNTNFGVTTFVFGLNAPPPPTLSPGGTLTLPSGIGVSGVSGGLTSVAGIDVGNFQTTNTAPDFLQAHLSGAKTIETPIGAVSVNPTPLYSAPGPQGSGIPPALLQVASPGQPETALQNLQRQYSALQSPLLNDWLNAQRAKAIHNTQNQALRAIAPEYFNAGAVQQSEFAPGLGSPSNTGLYGFMYNTSPAQAGVNAGPLPSNLSSSQINQALGQNLNYLAGQPGTFGYSGGGFSNPGGYGPGVGGATVEFGDFPSYGGVTPDQFESIWVAANQGQIPGIQYVPPVDSSYGGDYTPSGDNLEFSGPPSVFREEVQPPGYYGDVSGPVSVPDWFNMPGLGDIPAEWIPFSEGQFPVPEQPDFGNLLPQPTPWQPPVQPEQPAPSWTDTLRSIATPYDLATPETSGIDPNITIDQVAGVAASQAPVADTVQAAQPNAGAQPVISDVPTVEPTFSQMPLPTDVNEPTFASMDLGGVAAPPADVYTDPGVSFDPDVLYPGGKSQLPLPWSPPTSTDQRVQNAADLLDKTQGMTLGQLGKTFGLPHDDRTPAAVDAYKIDLNNLPKAAADIWQMLPTGASLAGYSEASILQMLQTTYDKILSKSGTDRQSVQDARSDIQQDIEEGPGAYGPAVPSYTPVPNFDSPATPNFNPDNIRPPADIPYNNATAAPPASYDLGSASLVRPDVQGYGQYDANPLGQYGPVPDMQAGYRYLPGTFGEIDPYYFSSAPYPGGGYGGGTTSSEQPLEMQAGYQYPSGAFAEPPGGPIQAGYRYIPGLFGDNPDPYGNFAPPPYQLGQGYGGGFEEAPPPPPEMQAGYNFPSGSLGGAGPAIDWMNLPNLNSLQEGVPAAADVPPDVYTGPPISEAWPGSGSPLGPGPDPRSPEDIAARAAEIRARGTVSDIDTSDSRFNYYEHQGTRPGEVTKATIDTPYGPITVSADAASDFGNFFQTLSDAGFPTGAPSGSLSERQKFGYGGGAITPDTPLSHISEHAWGAAVDVNNSTELTNAQIQWIATNPDIFQDALQDNNISWGHAINLKFGPDTPHMEWSGPNPGAYGPIQIPTGDGYAPPVPPGSIPTQTPTAPPVQVPGDWGGQFTRPDAAMGAQIPFGVTGYNQAMFGAYWNALQSSPQAMDTLSRMMQTEVAGQGPMAVNMEIGAAFTRMVALGIPPTPENIAAEFTKGPQVWYNAPAGQNLNPAGNQYWQTPGRTPSPEMTGYAAQAAYNVLAGGQNLGYNPGVGPATGSGSYQYGAHPYDPLSGGKPYISQSDFPNTQLGTRGVEYFVQEDIPRINNWIRMFNQLAPNYVPGSPL